MMKAVQTPRIAVVIPAYKVRRHILEVISEGPSLVESIFVVDDGSKDGTAEVAETFGGCVKVLRKPNGGPASARNLGARHASGDWLAMLFWRGLLVLKHFVFAHIPLAAWARLREREQGRSILNEMSRASSAPTC